MMALVTEAATGKYHIDLSGIPDYVWYIIAIVSLFSFSSSLFHFWRDYK